MSFRKFAAALLAALLLAVLPCPSIFPLPQAALAQEQGPDYSLARNWLHLPRTPNQKVDVFWVYPTVYRGSQTTAPVDDTQMIQAAQGTLLVQAGIFAGKTNLYAPLYRQANISVLSMDPASKERYLSVGLGDVQAAFDYYLQNLNHGQPFILAGHSQGSDLLTKLLVRNMARPALQKNLVAAYLIGWSVTPQDLAKQPLMKICREPCQTGCVITYNCVAAGYQDKAPTILPGAISVNPLTWRTDGQLAPACNNLGAVFFDEEGRSTTIPLFTSAQNQAGGLVVVPRDPQRLTHMPFGPGVYHAYDYTFFYENLKNNLTQRIEAFLIQRAARR